LPKLTKSERLLFPNALSPNPLSAKLRFDIDLEDDEIEEE
jgi:hypothetical protein